MQVIKNSKEFTPAEIYELTLAPNGEKMTNHVGETLESETYCIYEDVNAEGEVRRVMAMKSDGKVFATNSPTFIRDFEKICGLMESVGTVPHHVRVEQGTSRNGRKFISCVYVD